MSFRTYLYPPDAIQWILWILLRYAAASLLKFAGYIHNHKILPGNIFGLILKNKMAATGVFFDFQQGLLVAL